MIKLFEMFAGYGGGSFGLQKAGIDFECVGYSEIDKAAIKCFEQNHKGKNFGDCTKINTNELPDFDLLTGGFPCQDVSIAGNRDLSKGRTNLYLEVLRIAEAKKPKFMLLENVKGLLSMEIDESKLIHKIVRDLERLGYGVCWKVLNSRDYGIPQNRERVWFVCKLGGWDFMEFMFPEKEELKIVLKDILEKEVDRKYYLSERMIKGIIKSNFQERKPVDIESHCRTLKVGGDVPCIITIVPNGPDVPEAHRVYLDNGISPTIKGMINITTRDIGIAMNIAQIISIKENKPVQLDLYHLQHGEIRPLSTYIPQDLDIHRCLQAGQPKEILIYKRTIRRLTPTECFRLMGFLNDNINLDGLSDTQKYKLAGNGWDVNLVSKIFKRMFK